MEFIFGLFAWLMLLFTWFMFCIIVGLFAAYRRGRSGLGWFLLSCLISPLLAGLLVAVLPDRRFIERQRQESLSSRKCPFCAELIRRDAIVCRYCGRDLRPDELDKELHETPDGGGGTYRGWAYTRCRNGTLDLNLPSGKLKKFATAEDLKAYVDGTPY